MQPLILSKLLCTVSKLYTFTYNIQRTNYSVDNAQVNKQP